MGTSHTFAIHIWMDKTREKENLAPIFARITVNGKRTLLSLKVSNSVIKWDGHLGRTTGKSPVDIALNEYLDQVCMDLNRIYQLLISEGKFITSRAIKSRYLGLDADQKTLLHLVNYHNTNMKASLAWGTLKNYFTTEKYLERFLKEKYKVGDVFLKQLSYSFIIDFEYYLKHTKSINSSKPLSNNGVMKHLERLRKLMNLALELEWIDKHPFARFKLRFDKFERDYLSARELQIFTTAQLPKHLLETQHIFCFACYTGLPYSDIQKLSQHDIVVGIDGKKWIVTSRVKNGKTLKVPLLDIPLEILKLYENDSIDGHIFPQKSNQHLNKNLKEISYRLNIEKNITFHSARHTFATTVTLGNGVPISTVSKMLGHSRITTTQVYAKVLDETISRDMEKLGSFLSQRTSYGS